MRLPFWVNYFDHAFNFFTSFGYFDTRRENNAAMRSIVHSLKPGGTLLFDYLNVPYIEARLRPDDTKVINTTTYEIHRWQDKTHFFKRIRITDPELPKPLEFCERIAKFRLEDFIEMLSRQTMQVTAVFGNYALEPYNESEMPRLIIIATRNHL